MTDIFSYLKNRRKFTYRVRIPTDSVITEIEADPKYVHIRKKYEVETILAEAERIRKLNESSNGFTRGRTMRHTGVYPAAIHIKYWRQAKGDAREYDKLIKAWLQEHSKFATVSPRSF